MPVPSTIADLSTTAGNNSPAGTDVPNTNTGPDDYLRALASIIRREQAQFTAVASAATVDLGAIATGNYGHITGTVTITSFGTVAAGIERTVVFDGVLTLTHNATSLILRTGANRTTAAGDVAVFVSEGGGNWREKAYHKVETAYQPLDDQLTTLAGITAQQATDLAAVSTFMGTVLNDADAATARATLGLPALLNQNYGSDGVTKIITNTTAGVDFNTHTSAGVYNFDAASSANAPVTGLGWIFLEVFRHSNLDAGFEYTVQIAHDMNAGTRARSWTRRQVNGSWSAWQLTTPVAPGDAPIYACRAWVNFNGADGAIRASGNVASVTRNGVGDYTINFATAMPDASYSVCGVASLGIFVSIQSATAPTASAVRLDVRGHDGISYDPAYVNVAIFR